MDPPTTANALSPLHTPFNTTSVPVSPKSNAPPQHTPPQSDDSNKNERAPSRPSEAIKALSFKLLVKIQKVFGAQSKEFLDIHRALYVFQRGDMSKREAHHIMTEAIGDNYELNQDLFNILNHRDAAWEPEDWSQPIKPPAFTQLIDPTSPDVLQPQHEPQFARLPAMFEALNSGQYTTRPQSSINPAVLQAPSTQYMGGRVGPSPYYFSGYDTPWNHNPFVPNGLSSPAPLVPSAVPLSQYRTPHSWGQEPTLMPSTDLHRATGLNSTLPSYSGPNYVHSSKGLPNEQFYQQYTQGRNWQDGTFVSGLGSGTPQDEQRWPYEQDRAPAEVQESPSAFSPQEQSTPMLVSGQLSSTNASPSVLGTPSAVPLGQPAFEPFAVTKHERNDTSESSAKDPNLNDAELRTIGVSGNLSTKPLHAQPTYKPGSFIHGICGKGFPSRSAVKKHHWGPKSGDLNTTRGCWARHGKPDRAWDEHPSCKEDISKSGAKKPKRASTDDDDYKPTSSRFKVPPAPMIPHGLDTLVTAASVASKIDAPKPQDGRNDSVVAHLDAQAAANERKWAWMAPSEFGGARVGDYLHGQEPSPAAGFGNTHIEQNRVLNGFVHDAQTSQSKEDETKPNLTASPATASNGNGVNKKRQRAPKEKAGASECEQKPPPTSMSSSSPDSKRIKS